ncbi:MAG: HDOD domain-containing protein [Candidatus Thiodiazotropha sp.]|jgi:HD-like signal output (HDOD) protein
MQSASQVKFRVRKLQYLPPLSTTATHLLEMLSDDNLTLLQLGAAINQDPGLSARILGLANSAYFGQKNPILTIEEAIIRVLGLNMVKSLAFSIAASGVFETKGCRSFDLQEYWRHSLSIAMFSRQVCLSINSEIRPDADGIYLAGLLYELGVLVLVHEFPQEYAKVLQMSKQQPDKDRLALETEIIGTDHFQAGVWLGHRWHLPEMVVRTIAHETREDVDSGTHFDSLLVGSVAQWIKNPLPTESKLTQPLPELETHFGLSKEQLNAIKEDFLNKEEEIQMIAKMLAN